MNLSFWLKFAHKCQLSWCRLTAGLLSPTTPPPPSNCGWKGEARLSAGGWCCMGLLNKWDASEKGGCCPPELVGDCREGEETPGGVGELQNEGALEPGGVMDPNGEVENILELLIIPLGEPEQTIKSMKLNIDQIKIHISVNILKKYNDLIMADYEFSYRSTFII